MSKTEWEKYKFDIPLKDKLNTVCQEFFEIHHFTHLENTRRILHDQYILPIPIAESDKYLIERRPCVIWTSPNTFNGIGGGSYFGGIQFVFKADEIIGNFKIYWFGSVKENKVDTARFLITNKNYNKLTLYNPEIDNGPFKLIEGKFYRKDTVNIHFLLERELSLNCCQKIVLGKHNSNCCKIYKNCEEMDFDSTDESIQLLSFIIANNENGNNNLFTTINSENQIELKHNLYDGLNYILHKTLKVKKFHAVTSIDTELAILFLESCFYYLSVNRVDSFLKVVTLFSSYEEFECLFLEAIKKKFGLTNTTHLTE